MRYVFIFFAFIVSGCASVDAQGVKGDVYTVDQVLEKLHVLNGKRIIVKGYYHSAFEESAIYNDKKSDYRNALWVGFGRGEFVTDEDVNAYQRKKNRCKDYSGSGALIEGVVDVDSHGHGGVYKASIIDSKCIGE